MTTLSLRSTSGDIEDDAIVASLDMGRYRRCDCGDPLVAPVAVIDLDPSGEADDVDAVTVKLFFVAGAVGSHDMKNGARMGSEQGSREPGKEEGE